MKSKKKFITKYLDTIIELSNETGISKKEARTILDITLSNQNPESVNFELIKTEIKTFITINIFSLVCKL
ncbi:hypothetical protein IDH29_04015 [Pelagibacterales bacterium SAG-MED06]|jgi:hypothetical protein|nr:hypothetical protein [Pelagibacterales bacterium SAG-MED50]MBD1168331.1 hypothetical protein [Pelagibacterales bacterium SAG-MED06]|tara:strand:- start:332 stop:541 length:210 start_codon:yes stop_codon:yes gene_type:complete